jgi:hypothetical protein
LTDGEYAQLQLHLANDPEAEDVIPGTGAFRKVRWGDRRRGQSRRGGLRRSYYLFLADSLTWLVTLYGKHEAVDLTPDEKKLVKAAADEETRQRTKGPRSRSR